MLKKRLCWLAISALYMLPFLLVEQSAAAQIRLGLIIIGFSTWVTRDADIRPRTMGSLAWLMYMYMGLIKVVDALAGEIYTYVLIAPPVVLGSLPVAPRRATWAIMERVFGYLLGWPPEKGVSDLFSEGDSFRSTFLSGILSLIRFGLALAFMVLMVYLYAHMFPPEWTPW